MASTTRYINVRAILMALLLPVQAYAGYPSQYAAEAIEAWVVDAETKKPLEGVIVTANWELEAGTVGGSIPVGQLMVMETVTDRNGRFYFPAWGSKPRGHGYLVDRDPQILMFKNGYESGGLQNTPSSKINKASLRRSEWHGKTIELQKPTFRLRHIGERVTECPIPSQAI